MATTAKGMLQRPKWMRQTIKTKTRSEIQVPQLLAVIEFSVTALVFPRGDIKLQGKFVMLK
jgi:hypothetical protein